MPRDRCEKCAICSKKKRHEVSLFIVPTAEHHRSRWIKSSGVTFKNRDFVCQDHFSPADFICPPGDPNKRARLQPGAVPVLKLKELVKNVSTQTDTKFEDRSMAREINLLRKKVNDLQKDLLLCKKSLKHNEQLEKSLRTFLTEGQIRRLQNPEKRLKWDWPDISNAMALHAAGARAYRHLLAKGLPLPHESALQRRAATIKVDEGILEFCLESMQDNFTLSDSEKLCVISFDEMKLSAVYEYDLTADMLREPTNYAQVVMARGLKKAWKQPIYYSFDQIMTKDIVYQIITALASAGFTVVALTSDMGTANQALWKDLGITTEKPWFESPTIADERVFVFADAPHLLNLVRDNFIESGLLWEGQLVTTLTVKQVIDHVTNSDLLLANKLTEAHITVRNAAMKSVKLAAQLFSHTTANAILCCQTVGQDLCQASETAAFVQLMSDWFDVLNSRDSTLNSQSKKSYGKDLTNQIEILRKMDEFMSQPIIPGNFSLAPFQRGILQTNNALRELFEYVKKFEIDYIPVYQLNLDVLWNFFSTVRSRGGYHEHASPKEFKYRLRKYIMENMPFAETTDEAGETELKESSVFSEELQDTEKFALDLEKLLAKDSCIMDAGHDGVVQYVAGYIIKKLKLNDLDAKALKTPSQEFLNDIRALEAIFNEVNESKIVAMKNFVSVLLQRSSTIKLPQQVKKFFFKCRMHFRIRQMNKTVRGVQKAKQRIASQKKFIKTTS